MKESIDLCFSRPVRALLDASDLIHQAIAKLPEEIRGKVIAEVRPMMELAAEYLEESLCHAMGVETLAAQKAKKAASSDSSVPRGTPSTARNPNDTPPA